MCKHDTREQRPDVFKLRNLFILPIKNGTYAILRGEGYVDIPSINTLPIQYSSKLDFEIKSASVGNSEMQHLDFAYATSLIRTFMNDDSLVLSIRGRKYTPEFSFKVGKYSLKAEGVQTEVDAGYEGRQQIVLVEAKNSLSTNVIIRQLFYPYRQWNIATGKMIISLFFERRDNVINLWQYDFEKPDEYNTIRLLRSGKYIIDTSKTA